jgi:sugar O-acyltransferase (sialic acid O-acetyltransferase NeuD family)
METKIYLLGASGHGKVIIDILHSMNEHIEAILDDRPVEKKMFNIPVIQTNDCKDLANQQLIISVGDNATRKKIAIKIQTNFHTAIHSKAIVSKYSTVAEGSVVMAGAIINPATSIGKHCIINTGSIIEHDCVIHDYVHISPNATLAGNVTVEEGTHIGIGASVIQGVKIGKWAVIGAGSVIIKDVPDYAVVVGNPGEIIKFKEIV